MKRPKVMIIGSLPPPYVGPNVAIANLIDSKVLNLKFQISFFDISDKREIESQGKFDFRNAVLGIMHGVKFLGSIFKEKPCIVYFGVSQGIWGYMRDLIFYGPAVMFGFKVVMHLRGSEFRDFYEKMPLVLKGITKSLLCKTSGVIVLADKLREIFRGLVEEERISVLVNGIDYREYVKEGEQNGTSRTGSVLWLSNLFVRKGILVFLEALPMVFQKHPEARITIAGEWENEKVRKEAYKILDSNGMKDKVCFVGKVGSDMKKELYKSHDVFVFCPVKPEGMPWVILEAMSASLPVISTRQGAIPEVVEDGKTGFIVNPVPKDVAQKICFLLGDPVQARRMGNRGFDRVKAEFSEEEYFKKLGNIFEKALKVTPSVQKNRPANVDKEL